MTWHTWLRYSSAIRYVLVGGSVWPYVATAVYIGVFFLAYGMGIGMVDSYTTLAQNLFAPLNSAGQTLYTSPLGPALAYLLGISSQKGYILYSLGVTALCVWALVRSAIREAGGNTRRSFDLLALLALTPLLSILFSNICKTDPFIIIFYLAFIAARHPLLRNISVACLLLSHREVGILMLAVHLVLTRGELARWREWLPGVIAALAILQIYQSYLPAYAGRIDDVLDKTSWSGWLSNAYNLPLLAWAAFGWFWGVIGYSVWKKWLPMSALAIALAIPLGAAVITLDTTRIAILIGFPLVWTLGKKYLEREGPMPYRLMVPLMIASFIQARYQTPEFRFIWTNWHTSPIDQMKVWVGRYL